jgi:hypothetical protein
VLDFDQLEEPTMTENVENLVLEQLRAIRADIGELKENDKEMLQRLARLEMGQANINHGLAFAQDTSAEQSLRYDRLKERIERIERRLELI